MASGRVPNATVTVFDEIGTMLVQLGGKRILYTLSTAVGVWAGRKGFESGCRRRLRRELLIRRGSKAVGFRRRFGSDA